MVTLQTMVVYFRSEGIDRVQRDAKDNSVQCYVAVSDVLNHNAVLKKSDAFCMLALPCLMALSADLFTLAPRPSHGPFPEYNVMPRTIVYNVMLRYRMF
jgi:hypothetical protein